MGVCVRQKRKGGPWWLFIRHGGRRRSKQIGDKKEANKLAKELRAALAAGDLGLVDEESEPEEVLTFGAYAGQCLDRWKPDPNDPSHGLKKSTHTDYSGCVKNRIKPKLGTLPLVSISRRDVKDFEAELRAEGLTTVNVRKHLRILSSILSEAVEEELLANNPVLELRKRRRSKGRAGEKAKIDPLTREELATLLEKSLTVTVNRRGKMKTAFKRFHPLLLTLAHAGLRIGEALALKWGDIDWQGTFLRIERSYVRGEVSETKSGKTRRVYMTAELRDTLRATYRERFERVVALDPEQQAAMEEERGEHLDKWVFPDTDGGLLDDHNFRRRVFEPLLAAAGLRKVRIHDLRHGYASMLLAVGKPLKFVQEQLGHHSPSFTLSTYGHLLRGDHEGLVSLAPAGTPMAPAGKKAGFARGADSSGNPCAARGKEMGRGRFELPTR